MNVTSTVDSHDGTPIAFERRGSGPVLILIGGALRSPVVTPDLAERLARRFTVISYDRRGRGSSGDTPPYAPEREVEDLRALVAEVGGTAWVYGHSSGAGLALYAAARGLFVTGLVLHDPAFAPDDEARGHSRELAETLKVLLAQDRRAESLTLFLTSLGLPPEVAEAMSKDPEQLAVAHTIPYDFDILADGSGGRATFLDEARRVTAPALVLAGRNAPSWMTDVGRQVAEVMPNGQHRFLDTRAMIVSPEELEGALAEFVAA